MLRPRARHERLLVRNLGDEVLVYDLDRFVAFCLNRPAAAVWRRCDGETSVERIATAVAADLEAPFETDAVQCALEALGRRGLLEPGTGERASGRSRREWLGALGRAGLEAALVPTVLAVVAPSPAEAATVVTKADCTARTAPNCGGNPCSFMGSAAGRCLSVEVGMSGMFKCACV